MKKLFFLTMIMSLFSLSFGAFAAETESTPVGADQCGEDANGKGTTEGTESSEESTEAATAVEEG